MKAIDEPRLESDLSFRFGYLTEFIGFDDGDVAAIHGAAERLAPLVPGLVDAVYVQLFTFDATKRHFVPRQHGFDGPVPDDIETLTLDHEQIKFRKSHLANYLKKLVTAEYNTDLVQYLDFVGQIHTFKTGSARLYVPLVQMNALLGFVSEALLNTILGLGLDREVETRTVRAFNKLLWIQNDLISRHYQA